MKRICVIGNSGGGKSTLARRIAAREQLPYFEIDAFLWLPGWKVAPAETYDRELTRILASDAWVLDGVGTTPSIAPRLERATDIVLVDLPLWVHFWLAADRQTAWALGKIDHPPAGMQVRPPTEGLFRNMWMIDQELMPIIRKMVEIEEARGKKVARITSLEELEASYAT
ncbi:MAG: adenylate kinase [Alphaproteobacteria bacterium]